MMKKMIFAWLLCMALPMTLAAAATLPQLRFTTDEARLEQYYNETKAAYNDSEITFISDDAKKVKGTERERMVLRLMQCTTYLRSNKGYTLFEWARLNTKIIQNQFFRTKRGETDIAHIERFDDVKKTAAHILESIDDMKAGSQMEMNGYSYADNIVSEYLAVLKSWMITNIKTRDERGNVSPLSVRAKKAIEEENDAWWKLTEAAVDYYDKCATDGEWYSMKPLEYAWVIERMCTRRINSLDLTLGYYLPGSPAAEMLRAYGKEPLDEEETPQQHFLSQGKKLMDGIAEYDTDEHSEGAREAALNLREAWKAFVSRYNNTDSLEENSYVINRAFANDLSLYIDTLLNISQGHAWE